MTKTTFTPEYILLLINQSDKSAINALITLANSDAETDSSDYDFLHSLATQAIWNNRDIERGLRSAESEVLSPKQMYWVRKLLTKYVTDLVDIANKRQSRKIAADPLSKLGYDCKNREINVNEQ